MALGPGFHLILYLEENPPGLSEFPDFGMYIHVLHFYFLSRSAHKSSDFFFQNRFYVESKLRTDLGLELKKLFIGHVADRHISNLISKYGVDKQLRAQLLSQC